MFGFSFGEFVMICVALVFVGPQKLPGLLRTLGQWVRKARSMVYDMRAQSGIDELRAEGFHGGLSEMRSLLRGQHSAISALASVESPADPSPTSAPDASGASPYVQPNFAGVDIDATREYPPEGPDAYGALPDDLVDDGSEPSAEPIAPLLLTHPEPVAAAAVAAAESGPPVVASPEPVPPAPDATTAAAPGSEAEATTSPSAPSSPPLTP